MSRRNRVAEERVVRPVSTHGVDKQLQSSSSKDSRVDGKAVKAVRGERGEGG
jgi:hypothetical protein